MVGAGWYYDGALKTGHDYFVLPPSGDLYSYPGQFQPDDQERFVRRTERDCVLMNTSGTVVSRHDIAGIWVAFFSRRQRYCC